MVVYDSNRKPIAVCEGKMYYTFNVLEKGTNHYFQDHNHKDILEDIQIFQKSTFNQRKLFFLILGHYDIINPPEHFKYSSSHNSMAKKYQNLDQNGNKEYFTKNPKQKNKLMPLKGNKNIFKIKLLVIGYDWEQTC